MSELKSKYEVILLNENLVIIKDSFDATNPTMTITNDMENVIENIGEYISLTNREVLYKDTDGRIDQVIVKDGKFSEFKLRYDSIEDYNKDLFKPRLYVS